MEGKVSKGDLLWYVWTEAEGACPAETVESCVLFLITCKLIAQLRYRLSKEGNRHDLFFERTEECERKKNDPFSFIFARISKEKILRRYQI